MRINIYNKNIINTYIMSDKTASLYEKNIKRLIDAGLDIKKPKQVIKWIDTVKSQRGKNFSPSTKRNIYTAILSEQGYKHYQNENIFAEYKKQQDELNNDLFKKYKKNGTINAEKTKEKQEAFKQQDYDKIIGSLIKQFDEPIPDNETRKIYGKMNGDFIYENINGVNISERDLKLWNLSKNDKVSLKYYVLMKMFYIYNFRNEVGRLMIINKSDFDKKYKDYEDERLKDENFIVVDGDNFTIVRSGYKTSKTYGTIVTEIQDQELKDVIDVLVYGRRFVKTEDTKPSKLKWTKKAVKDLTNQGLTIPDYDFTNDKSDNNFRYKTPVQENLTMDTYLNDGFLFGDEPMDSAGVSNSIRNIGKKYLKYDTLSPNMITKLSLEKYSEVTKEMKEKADNRGHSTSTQSMIYVPK